MLPVETLACTQVVMPAADPGAGARPTWNLAVVVTGGITAHTTGGITREPKNSVDGPGSKCTWKRLITQSTGRATSSGVDRNAILHAYVAPNPASSPVVGADRFLIPRAAYCELKRRWTCFWIGNPLIRAAVVSGSCS